jgi:hypothetical protein
MLTASGRRAGIASASPEAIRVTPFHACRAPSILYLLRTSMTAATESTARRDLWLHWPRLYLDTGLLLDIADGNVKNENMDDLLATMARGPVLLVVSKDHIQDVLPLSRDESTDQFAAAVERFPHRAVVDREPHDIEPWSNGPQDIGLSLIDDVSGLVRHPAARPYMAKLSAAQEQLHRTSSVSQAERRGSPPLSAKANELALRCLATLAGGLLGTDVSDIIAWFEPEFRGQISDAELATIIATLTPWAALVRDHVRSDADHERLFRDFRDNFGDASRLHSPGMFLARRLAACWSRDLARKPRRSDSVDGMHASYFPYVDVATCDRSAFTCLAPHIESVRGSRTPRIFRNNDLASVIDALRSCIEYRAK